MSPSEFVYKEVYTRLLQSGIREDIAEMRASNSIDKYKKNMFGGNVSAFIDLEVSTTRKLYGVMQ